MWLWPKVNLHCICQSCCKTLYVVEQSLLKAWLVLEGKYKTLSQITWASRPGLPRGSLHKTGTTQHPTLHINKHTFAYKELVRGYVFNLLPRGRRKSRKAWGRSADRFPFLGLSQAPSGWRAAGSLGFGKSPLGLQWSQPISQLPAARMAVGGHLWHMGFLAAQDLSPDHKDPCHLARVTATSWLLWGAPCQAAALAEAPSSTATSFPPPRAGKTACHLLITWIRTTRLYLIQTQHLTTANLQDESSLNLLLPFM